MKTLPIFRKIDDSLARTAIADQALDNPVALLLIQDGVLAEGDFPEKTYVYQEDLAARAIKSPYFTINYPVITRLITERDRVVTW